MAKKRTSRARYVQPYRYPSPNVPLSAIRRFARQIAERFHPEKIILFGSYAYGKPTGDSDVDLLVVMNTNERSQIKRCLPVMRAITSRDFATDVIVRTPTEIDESLSRGSSFIHDVVTRGRVLYERRK